MCLFRLLRGEPATVLIARLPFSCARFSLFPYTVYRGVIYLHIDNFIAINFEIYSEWLTTWNLIKYDHCVYDERVKFRKRIGGMGGRTIALWTIFIMSEFYGLDKYFPEISGPPILEYNIWLLFMLTETTTHGAKEIPQNFIVVLYVVLYNNIVYYARQTLLTSSKSLIRHLFLLFFFLRVTLKRRDVF